LNKQYIKDTSKAIQNTPIRQELPPGTPRRYEPTGGVGKHNERIHKESRYADTHKNLPFTFKKPLKPVGRSTAIQCNNCGYVTSGTTATVGIICPDCGKFSTVSEVNIDW
jgi:rubrerythrin